MKEKLFHNKGLSEEAYKLIDKEIAKYPPAQKKSAVIAAPSHCAERTRFC